MPLSNGEKLGPYEIVSPIGSGGMGAVWKARDPRLNRDVAIKFSDSRFSGRFGREARAIAALNADACGHWADVVSETMPREGQLAQRRLGSPLPNSRSLGTNLFFAS